MLLFIWPFRSPPGPGIIPAGCKGIDGCCCCCDCDCCWWWCIEFNEALVGDPGPPTLPRPNNWLAALTLFSFKHSGVTGVKGVNDNDDVDDEEEEDDDDDDDDDEDVVDDNEWLDVDKPFGWFWGVGGGGGGWWWWTNGICCWRWCNVECDGGGGGPPIKWPCGCRWWWWWCNGGGGGGGGANNDGWWPLKIVTISLFEWKLIPEAFSATSWSAYSDGFDMTRTECKILTLDKMNNRKTKKISFRYTYFTEKIIKFQYKFIATC